MKYFVIAGNNTADISAARLVDQIRRNDVRAEFYGVGGKHMQNAEIKILQFSQIFAFKSIYKLIANLKKISAINELKKSIKECNPDILILVSSSAISIKMASYAKKQGIRTCYYMPPQAWSWPEARIRRMKKSIDKLLVTLPFEVDFFKTLNIKVEYVGNPFIDAIKSYKYDPRFEVDPNQTTIAVLPGVRRREIASSAKIIREIAKLAPNYKFLIAGVGNVGATLYAPYSSIKNAEIYFDKTYDIVKRSNAAIVTSGSATIETALLNCPQVVVNRGNTIKSLLRISKGQDKWISLVNLILQKEVVKEFMQQNYKADKVLEELHKILNDHHYCAGIMQDYQVLLDKMGAEPASKRAALIIEEWLEKD